MSANIERLTELLETRWVPYGPRIVAQWLADNGVLAVDTLTDDQCYGLSDGQHKATRPGWNMRDDLEAIAKGETP